MSVPASPKIVQFFLPRAAGAGWIAAAFLVLTAAGIYGALRVPDDPAIDRLIVPGDPIARATAEFDRLFPEGEQALLMLEAPDPFSLASLRAADRLEHGLAGIAHVQPHSLLDLHRHGSSAGEITPRRGRPPAHLRDRNNRCSAAPDFWAITISASRSSCA